MKNRPPDNSVPEQPVFVFPGEEALDIILDNLREILLLVDRQLRIVHITENTRKAVLKNFGLNINADTSVLELVSPERQAYMKALYAEVFEGFERKTITEVPRGNERLVIETFVKPARSSTGEIVGAVVTARDVTEQKHTENLLRETEERWRFALEGGNQAVWDWNIKTGDVYYSQSYKKLYGFVGDELKGRIEEWKNRIHPDDRKSMDQAIDEHIQSLAACYESTYRVQDKQGRYRWILARGMLVERDATGKPVRMIGTHTDITAQIAAERSYKILFYSNPLPMWTYDVDTLRFLSVNEAAVIQYGYSRDEFLAMTIKDIRPPEDIPLLMHAIQLPRRKGYQRTTHRHQKKDGNIIFVEVSTAKVDESDNNSVLVVAHDITSKVQTEEALQKSNERFVLAGKATSQAIYDWNILTDQINWTEGFQNLFGFDPLEVSLSVWEALIHAEDRQRVFESLSAAVNDPDKTFWSEDYRLHKKDNGYCHVTDRGFIIREENGRAVRMIGSMQDITGRKYAEQILSLERTVFELSTKPEHDFVSVAMTLLKGMEEIHAGSFTALQLVNEQRLIEKNIAPSLPAELLTPVGSRFLHECANICKPSKDFHVVDDFRSGDSCHHQFSSQYGINCAWSLPVLLANGQLAGCFHIFHPTFGRPTKSQWNVLERVRHILRLLMEHHSSLEQIKKANERFDMIRKATHDLIWDWDLTAGKIYREPLGIKKVYGVDQNLVGDRIDQWLARIHPHDQARVRSVIAGIMRAETDDVFDVEYRFERKDGTYAHVYDRGVIIRDTDGRPVRIMGAAQDITERKRLEQELLQNELEKQKAINQASVDSQEQERTEIGKELHDNVNQILTTTKLYLDLALSSPELKEELIEKSGKNLMTAINEIRQLSRSLMDPTIGDLGLIDSINDLIENVNFTRKIHVTLQAEKRLELFLNQGQRLTIFRIIQESLNNSLRHANATTVFISCKLRGSMAELSIEDDGIGFDPLQVRKGAGLKNIQNRVYLVNGTNTIDTAPGKGCKITINFPVNK